MIFTCQKMNTKSGLEVLEESTAYRVQECPESHKVS